MSRSEIPRRHRPPAAPVLLLLMAAACATPRGGPEAVAAGPLPDRDPADLASWIADLCHADLHTRLECREAAVVRIARERGIATAMDVVARLDAPDGEGHVLTHMVGIRGYRGAATVAESFGQCTPIHQSGCYHGVIQAYFDEVRQDAGPAGLDVGRMDAVCAPYGGLEGDRWQYFQCLHGVGHGVMLVHDNHLPRALASCDLLSGRWEREVCYGGAFMENVMGVVAPHHDNVAGALDRDDPAGHHDHHAHHDHHDPAAQPFPPIDPDDLHYPCSVLDERYRMACYDMQTAAMLHLLDGDIAATAAACRGAPDPILRSVCHRSLGRDINAITSGVHARSAALCALAAPADRGACHTGVVKNVIDVTADPADGLAYCAVVADGVESQACYRAIGEQTAVLLANPADRRRFCDALDNPGRTACLQGSGAAPSTATGNETATT